jgi:hypothetical protein
MSTPERGSRAKLDEVTVLEIKKKLKAGSTHRKMAEEYSVHLNTISKIARGLAWKHVSL